MHSKCFCKQIWQNNEICKVQFSRHEMFVSKFTPHEYLRLQKHFAQPTRAHKNVFIRFEKLYGEHDQRSKFD